MLSAFSRNKKAISLIELIIATAILSTGIIVVVQAVSFSARMSILASDTASAVILTQEKMQEWELKEEKGWLATAPIDGAGEKDKFTWQYNLSFNKEYGLYNFDFSTNWKSTNKDSSLIVGTYLR